MPVDIVQVLGPPPSWIYILLGVVATILAAMFASPLIVKIYENRKKARDDSRTGDRAVELNKDQELYKIRGELRAEVAALQQTRELILAEKLELMQRIFILDATVGQQNTQVIELNTKLLVSASEIEMLKRQILQLEKEKQELTWLTRSKKEA